MSRHTGEVRTGTYLFFFTFHSFFSNWHKKPFVVKGILFVCVEQYMMYAKAMLFGDSETAGYILQTQDPAEHKRLGRLVKGFDKAVWEENCERYVYVASLFQARQHKDVRDHYLSTGDLILVEASPYDKIWGVGLAADDPRILDPTKWRGQNRCGHVKMRVRQQLRKELEKEK